MRASFRSAMAMCSLFVMLTAIAPGIGHAQQKEEYAGWGKTSEYNSHYDAAESDDFKGVVEDIVDVAPMPGMAPGVALVVKDQDDDVVTAHLGPKGFVKLDSISLKKGDKIKLKGVWAEINGKDIFMASKIKKGDNVELKVRRTKDGVPFWTMSPEELAKEKEEQ